ncbi:6-phosphogluconolactonase [Scytonema sp. NUACC21]
MLSVKFDIQVVANAEEISFKAAEEFVHRAQEAIQARGIFTIALAGGSTPKSLYTLLASDTASFRERVPWNKVHFFWGDERHVPPDHPDSNYRMVKERLLSQVPVLPENVHRILTENPDPGTAANKYEQVLQDIFALRQGQLPRFDLVLLGMGPDGHTASLFPGTNAIHEHIHLVAAPWVEKQNTYRVTLTPPVLNNALYTIFLVSGAEKAETLRAVLEDDPDPDRFPAQIIRPKQGRLLWLVDRAAARLLRLEQER